VNGVQPARFLSEAHYRQELAKYRRYDPSNWWDTLHLHASSFLLKPWLMLISFTIFLTKLCKDWNPELLPMVSLNPMVHTVMGSALSFIIVFRTNAAYSRWWEGRLLWGQVSNNIRSIACRAKPMMKSKADFETLISQLVSFAVILKNFVRNEPTRVEELGQLLQPHSLARYSKSANPPLEVMAACSVTVREGIKTDGRDAYMANASFQTLTSALDVMAQAVGGMERIKNTPTPYGYIATLRTFILLWLSTMPFTLIGPFGWVAPAAIALLSFLFLNLETMAMEIEQPFGDDRDDLPIEAYLLNIESACLDAIKQ